MVIGTLQYLLANKIELLVVTRENPSSVCITMLLRTYSEQSSFMQMFSQTYHGASCNQLGVTVAPRYGDNSLAGFFSKASATGSKEAYVCKRKWHRQC